jgi:hypothetical protein
MSLNKSTKIKIFGVTASAAVVLGLAAVASGATGAYFSDSKNGTVSGTVGTVKVITGGGTGTNSSDLAFNNLLPGEPQTVTVGFQNTGTGPEDIWVVFQNPTALSALNNLGTYGELHIASSGTQRFDSNNLNDHASCPPGQSSPTQGPCAALPSKILLQSALGSGAAADVSFKFNYAGKLSNAANVSGGVWNAYPAPGQSTVDGTSGSGLPYQIVATQVGQVPGA